MEPGPDSTSRTPWYIRLLEGFMAFVLFLMMALTFTDVMGRYFFDTPIAGGFELVAFLLGILIFSGMALVTRDEEHIVVGLFDGFFRGRVQQLRRITIRLGTTVMVGFIAVLMWSEAEFLRANNMYAEYLDIPLAPVQYVVAFLAALTFLFEVGTSMKSIRNRRKNTATNGL